MRIMKLSVLLLLVCISCYNERAVAQEVAMFQDKIVPMASERNAGDQFGGFQLATSVSIFGDYAVVGASQDDFVAEDAGAAYLFKWDPNTCRWREVEKFFAQYAEGGPNIGGANDFFGMDISINGNMIAVGAPLAEAPILGGAPVPNAGAVYIYEIVFDVVEFRQVVTAFDEPDGFGDAPEDSWSADNFGMNLDLSDNHLIVGAWRQNFRADGTIFGAMSNAGAAYVYDRSGTTYNFQNKLVASDRSIGAEFGMDVSIHGDYAVVGAKREGDDDEGAAYVFELDLGNWVEIQKLEAFDEEEDNDFGRHLAIHEDFLAISCEGNPNDEDGDPALDNIGAVYMYDLNTVSGEWDFFRKIVPDGVWGGDQFGSDVDVFDDYVVVGSWGHDQEVGGGGLILGAAGKAYIYERNADWDLLQEIVAVDRDTPDHFGRAVAMDGERIIVASPDDWHMDDEPDYDDNPLESAGSAYMFELNIPADEPVITAGEIGCIAGTVTLTITGGDLNDAVAWEWYEGDCTGDPIGDGISIDVTLDGATTYCARGVGQCDWFLEGDCGCITIEADEGVWHKTTINGMRDQGNDIVTDSEGSVYMVGQYFDHTEFEGNVFSNVAIAAGNPVRKSYIVKYDNCGDLLWAAYSTSNTGSDYDIATKVTLDEANGFVYVAGNFHEEVDFTSGFGDFGTGGLPTDNLTSVLPDNQGYVAQFDMTNGELFNMDLVNVDLNTEVTALTINEITGDIFVGGHSGTTTATARMFVHQYSPDVLGIGAVDWSTVGAFDDQENLSDMDYFEPTNKLVLIGDYDSNFSLMGYSVSTAAKDAFVAKIDFSGLPSIDVLRSGNVSGNMWGNGISVNKVTGEVYVVGTFEGFISDAFFTAGSLIPSYSTNKKAYFLAFNNSMFMASSWATPKMGEALAGDVEGIDVAYNSDGIGYASFVGSFTTADAEFTDAPADLPYTIVGSFSNRPHIYSVAYESGGAGTFLWQNGTTDPVTNSGMHIPTSIAADQFGQSFIGGGYRGDLGYDAGAPWSGELNTISFGASLTMRVQSSAAGAFQMPSYVDDNNDSEIMTDFDLNNTDEFAISAFPNPVNDFVTIKVTNFNTTENGLMTVFNLDGKIVLQSALITGQVEIDFSDLDPGVYMIQVVNGEQNGVQRIVKY